MSKNPHWADENRSLSNISHLLLFLMPSSSRSRKSKARDRTLMAINSAERAGRIEMLGANSCFRSADFAQENFWIKVFSSTFPLGSSHSYSIILMHTRKEQAKATKKTTRHESSRGAVGGCLFSALLRSREPKEQEDDGEHTWAGRLGPFICIGCDDKSQCGMVFAYSEIFSQDPRRFPFLAASLFAFSRKISSLIR